MTIDKTIFMNYRNNRYGSHAESIMYPLLLVIVMWLVYWAEQLFRYPITEWGVLPRTIEGLKGIVFMPIIHSKTDIHHIINNSFPTFVLLAVLIHFYRAIAGRVFLFIWIFTGLSLWVFAEYKGAYHIGMSGVIYGLASFLFVSGVIRKYLPLQAISLFVVFAYGHMVWGIFPLQEKVSWEGHLMGALTGLVLAIIYRKYGIQRPKFQYEVEKEMGIEPPDLEGMYYERLRQQREREEAAQRAQQGYIIIYDYKPKAKEESKPQDESPTQ